MFLKARTKTIWYSTGQNFTHPKINLQMPCKLKLNRKSFKKKEKKKKAKYKVQNLNRRSKSPD